MSITLKADENGNLALDGFSEEAEDGTTKTRKANRKERRDFVRSQHRAHRLAYGLGLGSKAGPGHFIAPAAGDKLPEEAE